MPQPISYFRKQLSFPSLKSLFCWCTEKRIERKNRQIKYKLVIVLYVLKPAIVFKWNSAQGKPIKGILDI